MPLSKSLFTITLCAIVFCFFTTTHAEEKIVKKSSTKKGWLGVGIEDVTPKFARKMDLKIKEGAYVSNVEEESPAETAGITEGDVIVEFNGKKIEDTEQLIDAVQETAPDTKTTVGVMRGNEKKNLSVTVGKMPKKGFAMGLGKEMMPFMNGGGMFEGMQLMELNKQLGEYFGVQKGKGLLVTEVKKNSAAEKAGVKAGDVLLKIDNNDVDDMGDFHENLEDVEEGDKVSLEFLRKGSKNTVSLTLTEKPHQMMFHMKGNFPHEFNFNFDENDVRMMKKEYKKIQPELDRMKRDGKKVIIEKEVEEL